jgi:hypothetical protein
MKKDFFQKLKDGDFGLAKTYWGFYILVSIIYTLLLEIIFTTIYEPYNHAIDAVTSPYFLFVLYGAWNAAHKYCGSHYWKILGKVAVVLGFAGELYFLATNLLEVLS